jgi:hypothetical protein
VLARDADGADAAAVPVAVAGVVVGLAGRAEVMRPVDLHDDDAAVADHDEVRAAHADVAEPGPGRQEPAFSGTAAGPYRSVPVVSAPRSRLRVSAACPEHLLAMKVLAGRRRDADDITYLVKHLGLISTADVLAVCTAVFPDEPVPDRSWLILDDLFDEG